MKTILSCIVIILSFGSFGTAQEIIQLKNPSFEGIPTAGRLGPSTYKEWRDCGHLNNSAVDIQPGNFGVKLPAQEGETYVGLVTRDNETWEGITQELSNPLIKDKTYSLTIHLAKSSNYKSAVKEKDIIENFDNPIKIRIMGGNSYCEKIELLACSTLITHDQWKPYTFALQPKGNYKFLMIEAFYKTPTLFPYNGNVMMDNCSDIKLINKVGKDHVLLTAEKMETNRGFNAGTQPRVFAENNSSHTPKPAPKVQNSKPPREDYMGYVPVADKPYLYPEFVKEFKLAEDELMEPYKLKAVLIYEFIDADRKSGWVDYLKNHSEVKNRNLIRILNDINASEAASYLEDYLNAANYAPRKGNAIRGQLVHEDERKASISKIVDFLRVYVTINKG